MSADPAPLDPAAAPPIDRFCDLVLTGGVTDGVIYPWAILELAREYRFKNVGGTSVGAMAAALTAAAEYGRRYGSLTGFNEVLLKLPGKLSELVEGHTTRLFSLFQPAKSTKRLFDLFVSFFASESFSFGAESASYSAASRDPEKTNSLARRRFAQAGKFLKLVLTLVRLYGRQALLGGLLPLLGLVAVAWLGLDAFLTLPAWRLVVMLLIAVFILTLPAMLLFCLVLIALAVYRDLVHGLVRNGFGLCTGGRVDGTPVGQQPLVEWLHEGIQAAAGKPVDQPLTFKDLWDAPDGPAGHPEPPTRTKKKPRSIDLRMVTTNLTHGRPYSLPLDDTTSRLFFKIRELERFFPPQVLEHLKKNSRPYTKVASGDPDETPKTRIFLELPKGELPVVVAARLSLNFPVLFSAVPLWAIDNEAKPGSRRFRRCRFSDGGICSNFPIHLFDAAIPMWPTFGITLAPKDIWEEAAVWLPRLHDEGRGDSWFRFDDTRSLKTGKAIPPLDRLIGFFASIIFTAKDWSDKTAMRMPGVRDRTVHVYLRTGEGGLNLKMGPDEIMNLARAYGQPAGKELIWKFICPAQDGRPSFWDEHRWVRFNTYLVALRERLEALTAAAELAGHGKPISRQLREARTIPPLRDEISGLSEAQACELELLLAALKDLESKFDQSETPQLYKPVPAPSLRIRPPL